MHSDDLLVGNLRKEFVTVSPTISSVEVLWFPRRAFE